MDMRLSLNKVPLKHILLALFRGVSSASGSQRPRGHTLTVQVADALNALAQTPFIPA